jgi:hypothetical protein
MQRLDLQLNTPPSINRDLRVTLINETTGKQHRTTPFLDGTVQMRNLEPGPWRVKVEHPNFVHAILDRPIRVLPERPTFVPLRIPTDIFSNTPVRDIEDQDLGPEQARLDDAADGATRQANKVAGQPIFAADWNELAATVADVARSTQDLSRKVAPLGHDHPEIVERIDEVQANLERFFDVFGKTVVELQREIQKLALRNQIDEVLDQIPSDTSGKRQEMYRILGKLDDVAADSPPVYTRRFKLVGEELAAALEGIDTAAVSEPVKTQIAETRNQAYEMSRTTPARSYAMELEKHRGVSAQGRLPTVRLAFQGLNKKGG